MTSPPLIHPISSAEPEPEAEVFTLTIPGSVDARRLDQWLTAQLPELTRSRIQALMRQGYLSSASGQPIRKLSMPPIPGMTLMLTLPPAETTTLKPENIPLNILYEDDAIIVINKPPGLVVHPACGHNHGTLVHALLFHCPNLPGIGGERRPGIVHRLDMDTSGILVAAKTEQALQALQQTFATHTLTKHYIAIVHGSPPLEGTLDNLIGRSPSNRQKMAVLRTGGKRAITHWQKLAELPQALSAVSCRIETGRTHQIRVHMASLGTPIVGDTIYGKSTLDHRLAIPPRRQLLHARTLILPHPLSGEIMHFCAPFPEDFAPYLTDTLLRHMDAVEARLPTIFPISPFISS